MFALPRPRYRGAVSYRAAALSSEPVECCPNRSGHLALAHECDRDRGYAEQGLHPVRGVGRSYVRRNERERERGNDRAPRQPSYGNQDENKPGEREKRVKT